MRRVLIYRLGGLGDAIIALPALQVIARAFPDADRILLTNSPTGTKQATAAAIFSGKLIHRYVTYPAGLRDWRKLLRLRNEIRRLRPDLLVYLTEARGLPKTIRDAGFFLTCGILKLIGLPLSTRAQSNLRVSENLFEPEAARLLRCIGSLGWVDLRSPASWDLGLSDAERTYGLDLLSRHGVCKPFLVASIGTKVDLKDWGDGNWTDLVSRIGAALSEIGMVFIGAADEVKRSQGLMRMLHGPSANLCGALTPRESAGLLQHAIGFIGHDSGPMHLAAAVGTPTVAIFSARSRPGIWFPCGDGHEIAYPQANCSGCGFNTCVQANRCIRSIGVEQVWARVTALLSRSNGALRMAT